MASAEAGYYYPELVALALARGLPAYAIQQHEGGRRGDWNPGSVLHLPDATVLVVGLGAIGTEVARLLAPFGPHLIGTDAGPVHELHRAPTLDSVLPRGRHRPGRSAHPRTGPRTRPPTAGPDSPQR